MTLKNSFKAAVVLLIMLITPRAITSLHSHSRIHSAQTAPDAPVALVLGAGLRHDGTPMPVLADRLDAAADLLRLGKVKKLLLSGDNRFANYNEPLAMRNYLIVKGVPEDRLVLDYAGRRTYDSCYRAKAIFGLNKVAIVTQNFHLPRALYLCDHLGLESHGVSANLRIYRLSSQITWFLRELPATWAALLDIHLTHPTPVLGDQEPIDLE